MKKQTSKGMSTGAKIGIGATIAAAGVGAYLLFGPEGKKNRKAVKGWAVKMKGEIIEKMESMQDLTEAAYHKVIDEVYNKYAKVKGIDKKELDELVADIRKHWKSMAGTKKSKGKSKSKAAKKSRPKATKKRTSSKK
jgi:hypothetical protein